MDDALCGDGARGETCEHLWRMLRFGSHQHACERRDHGLRGGPRIEGGECPAGHCLPPAALAPTRPRSQHGVQLLPHDGVPDGRALVPGCPAGHPSSCPLPWQHGPCTREACAHAPWKRSRRGAVCLPASQRSRMGCPSMTSTARASPCFEGKPCEKLPWWTPAGRSRPPPPPYNRGRPWGCWRHMQCLGTVQQWGGRHAMTDRAPHSRKSHGARAPAQRAKRGSVTPLRGLMPVSFTPH
jgi:hypothetical protein